MVYKIKIWFDQNKRNIFFPFWMSWYSNSKSNFGCCKIAPAKCYVTFSLHYTYLMNTFFRLWQTCGLLQWPMQCILVFASNLFSNIHDNNWTALYRKWKR
jgi:hypothetical protein